MALTTTGMAILYAGATGLQYMGSRQGEQAAKRQGEYEALALEGNAAIADMQAKDALAVGADQESRHKAAIRQLTGSQRAAFAGSGVDVSSGSAADVQEDTAFLGELDRTTIRNNAAREAWGFTVNAADLRNRAKLTRAGARGLAQSYRNQGYSTLIGGATEVASLYRKR